MNIPGKGYPVEANGATGLLKMTDWNNLVIEAIGLHYNVWLNGTHVLEYESETAVAEGPVGIQLHKDRNMVISYRNLWLEER